jgi:hypothetical protein
LISGRRSRQEGKKEKKLIIIDFGEKIKTRREEEEEAHHQTRRRREGREKRARKEGSSDGFLGHFSLLLAHCPCGILARQSLLQQRQIH